MRLSGIIFIIVGIGISVASWMLMQNGQKMTLFIYTGVAMAVFGILRVYIDRGEGKAKKDRVKLEEQLNNYQQHHNADIPRICSICKTKNHSRANFCGNCGNRL